MNRKVSAHWLEGNEEGKKRGEMGDREGWWEKATKWTWSHSWWDGARRLARVEQQRSDHEPSGQLCFRRYIISRRGGGMIASNMRHHENEMTHFNSFKSACALNVLFVKLLPILPPVINMKGQREATVF